MAVGDNAGGRFLFFADKEAGAARELDVAKVFYLFDLLSVGNVYSRIFQIENDGDNALFDVVVKRLGAQCWYADRADGDHHNGKSSRQYSLEF